MTSRFPGLAGVERVLWRVAGIRAEEMGWLQYLLALLLFNALGGPALFALLMLQGVLPFNPQHLPGLSWDLALNTAISFVSNTNWQAYAGESTMSYLSQLVGLTVQNFLSRRHRHRRGLRPDPRLRPAENVDPRQCLGRSDAHYPVAAAAALSAGGPVLYSAGRAAESAGLPALYHPRRVHQLLPMGPVASQEAIKLLGTNGGGFFNANSAHPFENPTALTNLVQMLAIFLIPAALCFAFGEVVSDRRQGRAILWAMTLIFILCVAVVMWAETRGNPHLLTLGADSSLNMEGKESRFGILASSLFAVITTAASCGAVNAMHDSFTALGGMVPMWLMQIGEVVFRRRRLGPVRHAAVRYAGGIYRRADGRPHPGVPREENRCPGNENDRPRHSGHPDAGVARHGAGDDDRRRPRRDVQPRTARL